MKNFLKSALLVVLTFTFTNMSLAQRLFTGVIEYEITYSDADLDPATLAMLPRSVTVEVDGKRSRTEQQQGVMNIVKITNAENFTSVVLLDIMGQKYAIRSTKEEIDEAMKNIPAPEIKLTEETKTIAGIKAYKAILTFTEEDGSETVEEVYYSPEIGGDNFNFDTPYRGINGALLEYSNDNEMFKSKLVAKSISKKKIRPATFLIPTDYQEVTAEELQEIFGGM